MVTPGNQLIYNEQELLQRLRKGETAAFNTLYEQYWRELYIYVTRTIHSEVHAEDIVQELFSSIWKRREQLQIQQNIPAYLFSSAKYMCIGYLKEQQASSRQLQLLGTLQQRVAAPEAEMFLRIRELQQQFDAAINELPPRVKEVFILSRKQHLSQRQIAELLGISEQTVKKQIQQALKTVRPALEQLSFYAVLMFSGKGI